MLSGIRPDQAAAAAVIAADQFSLLHIEDGLWIRFPLVVTVAAEGIAAMFFTGPGPPEG